MPRAHSLYNKDRVISALSGSWRYGVSPTYIHIYVCNLEIHRLGIVSHMYRRTDVLGHAN